MSKVTKPRGFNDLDPSEFDHKSNLLNEIKFVSDFFKFVSITSFPVCNESNAISTISNTGKCTTGGTRCGLRVNTLIITIFYFLAKGTHSRFCSWHVLIPITRIYAVTTYITICI